MSGNLQPHIVFLNRFFFPDESATSQFTTDLAFELARRGHRVDVVTSRQMYLDPARRLPAVEDVCGVRIHRIPTSQRGRMNTLGLALDYVTFYLSCTYTLWRLLRCKSIVVVGTDPPMASAVVLPVARLRRATMITWLADLFPEIATELGLPFGTGRIGKLLRSWRNHSLRKSAVNVVLGDRMRTHLLSQGVRATHIREIPNWADGAAIQPLPKARNPLAIEWGLTDTFVAGYSGNMGRAHLFETIIEAMAALKARRDLRFLFIGDGVRKAELITAVKSRELKNVLFKPYQARQNLGDSLAVPDVHLISVNPRLEGFVVPSKFYSAAAAGRPVIYVGDLSGDIPILLSRYNCGLTVQQGDVQGLVNVIERLIDDRELYQLMAANARKAFEAHFDRPVAMAAWSKVIDELTPTNGDLS